MESKIFKRTASDYTKKNKKTTSKINSTVQSPQKLNHNITKFKVPMGSSGNLVGIFPIVLSEFETNIYCQLKYQYPIESIISKKSKIVVKKFNFISKNQKLFIDGYLEKNISITFNNTEKQNVLITIPFKTIIDITYSKKPNFDVEYKTISQNSTSCESYFSPSEKLFLVHEYTKLKETFEEIEQINSKEYVMNLIITLGISIFQNQKVFIPEPCDDATVIAEYDNSKNQTNSNKISHVEVGYNSKQKLIARVIKE